MLLRLDALCSQLLDLLGEDGFRGGCAVDTVGLDRDDYTATNFEEQLRVESDDTCLIRLGNVGKDTVDHRHEHAVLHRMTGILDDGNDVRSVLGHVDQVSARSVRELDGVDVSSRTDNVGNVGNRGSGGSTQVQNLGARLHVDVVDTTNNASSQLASERVPDSVFDLGSDWRAILSLGSGIYGDSLLAVDLDSRGDALGEQMVFLTARDEDTFVTMRFLPETD